MGRSGAISSTMSGSRLFQPESRWLETVISVADFATAAAPGFAGRPATIFWTMRGPIGATPLDAADHHESSGFKPPGHSRPRPAGNHRFMPLGYPVANPVTFSEPGQRQGLQESEAPKAIIGLARRRFRSRKAGSRIVPRAPSRPVAVLDRRSGGVAGLRSRGLRPVPFPGRPGVARSG